MSESLNSILIIDDNPMNLLLTSKILESAGYLTKTALSGQEGLKMVLEELPSLILLDISMPDMDGYEVCELLKANEKWKNIPVIYLTANMQTEDVVKGFKTGGVDYITKPFKSEELFVRVNTHLELAESRQTLDAIDQGFIAPTDNDFTEIINHLKERTKETHTLLNSLLQWTKIQTDGMSLQPTLVELHFLLKSCVQLLQAIADVKQIKINVQDGVFYAMCDEMSMHTVFRNLISNAVKFTNPGGVVNIGFVDLDSSVKVSIADNGIGMSLDVIQRIFINDEHFSSSGTGNEQGTGLGLMLVKDFVKKNNAKIEVNSQPGTGTKFTIEIPKE